MQWYTVIRFNEGNGVWAMGTEMLEICERNN